MKHHTAPIRKMTKKCHVIFVADGAISSVQMSLNIHVTKMVLHVPFVQHCAIKSRISYPKPDNRQKRKNNSIHHELF